MASIFGSSRCGHGGNWAMLAFELDRVVDAIEEVAVAVLLS